MKIITRLHQYIEFKRISLNSFDKSIGVSNGYIGKQIKNEASIGGDILEKISCIYTDLNIDWLITGRGEMLINETTEIKIENQTSSFFNLNLKFLREKENLSALAMSKKLNIAWATYAAYEVSTWPKPETLKAIAQMFDVTIDDLVTRNIAEEGIRKNKETENLERRIHELEELLSAKNETIATQRDLISELKSKSSGLGLPVSGTEELKHEKRSTP
jgi:transcriptional regulator with XRE-family HTH domain